MSVSEYSPEDKERLVNIRFMELFDSNFERRFKEAFDQRLMEFAELTGGTQQQQPPRATHHQPLPPQQQQPAQQGRRRSAFDIALGQALGYS